MFNLIKKSGSNIVLELCRVVTPDQAISFNNRDFIDSALHSLNNLFGSYPSDYYITGPYPDEGWKTRNGFQKAIEKNQYRDICHLLLSTSTYNFSFDNWSLNKKTSKEKDSQTILLSVSEKHCDFSLMEKFFESIMKVFPPDYGYIRNQTDNIFPGSETKIRRSFFSTSVSTSPRDMEWQRKKIEVDKGLLKDIYPINFINNIVFTNNEFQTRIVMSKTGFISPLNNYLYKWTLTNKEILKSKSILQKSGMLFD